MKGRGGRRARARVVWSGAQALERRLIDRLGGLRQAIDGSAGWASCPTRPSCRSLEEDTSLLGYALSLVGFSAQAQGELARASIPPVMLDAARALTPFFVFGADRPLARSEFAGEICSARPARPARTSLGSAPPASPASKER